MMKIRMDSSDEYITSNEETSYPQSNERLYHLLNINLENTIWWNKVITRGLFVLIVTTHIYGSYNTISEAKQLIYAD